MRQNKVEAEIPLRYAYSNMRFLVTINGTTIPGEPFSVVLGKKVIKKCGHVEGYIDPVEQIMCAKCKTDDNPHLLIICDHVDNNFVICCNPGVHIHYMNNPSLIPDDNNADTYCLDPPLDNIPDKWYCEECIEEYEYDSETKSTNKDIEVIGEVHANSMSTSVS